MCGRYALALGQRPSQVRDMLQEEDMPVADMPQDEGSAAPRQSYNFAPGYHGIVYRAQTPDWGAGPARHAPIGGSGHGEGNIQASSVEFKLQSMKWGLVPSWTKRNPEYGNLMKTINCRDDSLSTAGGMWTTMKARKRCVVIAQGFFEWLKTGPKDKLPHYVKRKDGNLMCFAGLWDCVQYEGTEEKSYTYTIITTDSNKQLRFLHDRMPVILHPGSDELRTWLDPGRYEWSRELQSLLRPFDGHLDVYPVTKDVGKVGNNSPSFIIPLDSKENKSNIANFFANASRQGNNKPGVVIETAAKDNVDHEKVPEARTQTASAVKRKAHETSHDSPPAKKVAPNSTNPALGVGKISATQNSTKSPVKTKETGTQKITNFFPNSA